MPAFPGAAMRDHRGQADAWRIADEHAKAQGWYHSDAYAAIRALRTENTEGDVLLVQGAPEGHEGGRHSRLTEWTRANAGTIARCAPARSHGTREVVGDPGGRALARQLEIRPHANACQFLAEVVACAQFGIRLIFIRNNIEGNA